MDEEHTAQFFLGTTADRQLLDAAQAGRVLLIDQALQNGARISACTYFRGRANLTSLHLAIENRHWAVAYRLLEVPCVGLEAQTARGNTPLLVASYAGNLAMIRKLVSLGANPKHRNESGESALDIACDNGYAEIADLMLHCGCDPNVADKWGWKPLHRACSSVQCAVAAVLLDNGADIFCARRNRGDTPLHIASSNGSLPLIRLLLNHGARTEDRDEQGRTSMHLAVERRGVCENDKVIEELLERGGDMTARDNESNTPFDLAQNQSNRTAVEQLLKAYRNKVLTCEGRFAAHAILQGADFEGQRFRTEIGTLTMRNFASLLRPLGPDALRVQDSNGMLPLHIAAGRGAPSEILDELVFPHALSVPDVSGSLPIHHASKATSPLEAIKYLVGSGGMETTRKRNNGGCLPLHLLLVKNDSSDEPSLEMVKYMVGTYPESCSTRNLDGDLPITLAGATSSLNVINFLMRRYPEVVNATIR